MHIKLEDILAKFGLLTSEQMASKLKVNGVTLSLLAKPKYKRKYYNIEDIEYLRSLRAMPIIHRYVARPIELYTLHSVAKRFHVPSTALRTLINRKECPAPTHPWKQRFFYKEEDMAAVEKAVDIRNKSARHVWQHKMPEKGLYSIGAFAKLIDVPEITLTYYMKEKGLPRPHIQHGRYKYYNKEDVEIIKSFMKDQGYVKGYRGVRKSSPKV